MADADADPEYPQLLRDEATRLLLERVPTAAAAERSMLQARVVRLNLSVASDLARRYRDRGIPADRLDQVAERGLVIAVAQFDTSRATTFPGFAASIIRNELRRHFRDHGWPVAGPDPRWFSGGPDPPDRGQR